MLEKAEVPGHRNVTGGILFGEYIRGYGMVDLLPEFESEAPLERKITTHELYVIQAPKNDNGSVSYSFLRMDKNSTLTKLGLTKLDANTGHDYTVLRARFDKWFASKAVEAGAMLATQKAVEDIIWHNGSVVGVSTCDEEIHADVVIDCGGVTSSLPEKAGLRSRLTPDHVYHGTKHVYSLDPRLIDERFETGEGAKAVYFLGDFMHSIVGGGFIYPNRSAVSVGVVAGLNSLVEKTTQAPHEVGKPLDLMEEMEAHPLVRSYIEGGLMVEYSAHNIPKGHKCMLTRPYASGFLIAGDSLGAFIKIGALIDGMRLAIASGIMAAKTFMHARSMGDYSARALSMYSELLSPIYRDVAASGRSNWFLERRALYETLPRLIFRLGLSQHIHQKMGATEPDARDALQKIQERTGLLEYYEDKVYSHIRVDPEKAASDSLKSWVSLCPMNCYTLVTSKGVFASFKDLLHYNLHMLRKDTKLFGNSLWSQALALTRHDIMEGKVRFDHVACVACGTCGVLGPPATVQFGHERFGHGVRYRYG